MYQITDFRKKIKTLQNTFVEFNSQELLTINF